MEISAKQLGVYALIAIFILSTVAIYFGSGGPDPSQSFSSTDLISGYASANATLSSYDPTLEVQSQTEATNSLIKVLRDEGKIVQHIKTSASTLLTLSDSRDIVEIASNLSATGASVNAQATFNTGPVTLVSESHIIELEPFAYKSTLEPVFMQGDSFEITFSASAFDGQLYSYSLPSILPPSTFQLEVFPKSVDILSTSTQILIPFENRNVDLESITNDSLSDHQLNYSRRSYVMFSEPVSDSVLGQISMNKPTYITSLQPNSFSISPDFNNKQKIIEDLSPFALEPQFPPSILNFASQENSTLQHNILSKLNDSNVSLLNTYSLQIDLPASAEYDQTEYYLPQQPIFFESDIAPADGYVLKIIAQPVGNRISSYDIVSYGPQPLQ